MTHSRIHSSHVVGAGALALFTLGGVACARQPVAGSAPATPIAAAAANTLATPLPVAVNCGPGQQALIRPGVVNGQAISQVDCVAVAPTLAMTPVGVPAAPAAVAWQPAAQPVVASDMETMRPAYRQAARPASYQTAEYTPERRVRSGRSWKKSALIIGSSAGVGAGVGAAVGGKKGALIGAAVGGGGATIWDQVTRRN